MESHNSITVPQGPKSIGKILDVSFKFLPTMVKQVLLLVVLISAFQTIQNSETLILLTGGIGYLIAVIGSSLGSFYLFVVQAIIASDAWLGKEISFSNAKQRIRVATFFKIIALSLRITVITLLGLLLLVIPGIVYAVNRVLSYYILLIEDCTISEALEKSKFLMTQGKWYRFDSPVMRITGLWLILIIIAIGGGVLVGAGSALPHFASVSGAIATLVIALGCLVTNVVTVYNATCFVGFYHDLRARYEGADLLTSIEKLEESENSA